MWLDLFSAHHPRGSLSNRGSKILSRTARSLPTLSATRQFLDTPYWPPEATAGTDWTEPDTRRKDKKPLFQRRITTQHLCWTDNNTPALEGLNFVRRWVGVVFPVRVPRSHSLRARAPRFLQKVIATRSIGSTAVTWGGCTTDCWAPAWNKQAAAETLTDYLRRLKILASCPYQNIRNEDARRRYVAMYAIREGVPSCAGSRALV